MPEMQSDNFPDIQYQVLQNLAETRQVCHDVVLFHWTVHKKYTKKKYIIPATQEPRLFALNENFSYYNQYKVNYANYHCY